MNRWMKIWTYEKWYCVHRYDVFPHSQSFFFYQFSVNAHRLITGTADIRNLLSSPFMRREIALPFRYRNQIKSRCGRKHPRQATSQAKKVKKWSGLNVVTSPFFMNELRRLAAGVGELAIRAESRVPIDRTSQHNFPTLYIYTHIYPQSHWSRTLISRKYHRIELFTHSDIRNTIT